MSLETEIGPLCESLKSAKSYKQKLICLSTEDEIMYVLLQFVNFSWRAQTGKCTEMEFLDINLTKNSIHLLHAVQSTFCWRILKKTILLSGFLKIRETRKLESIHE
jgi:hypothetical protein